MTYPGIDKALEDLRNGRMVLVFDAEGREEETDLTIASQFVTPEVVRTMRRDGGGLICVTVPPETKRKLGLPFLADILWNEGSDIPVLRSLVPNDIPYDEKSAFGITINHRKTYTGITDSDRALTIREFANFAKRVRSLHREPAINEFGRDFRSPGHVSLLNVANPVLKSRRGHTELCTALVVMAGLTPTATICEMMGDEGKALGKEDAKRYATERGLAFLEGHQIVEAWEEWSR
ncbi:MAG: 3,4-dihydroxy-2-butanone-4-phosphate synthase [Thermoplasmata archaeon]